MVEIKDFDTDSYELDFEEDTLSEERKFYVESYPNVNLVAERKLHCTSCNLHIGSAPSSENVIRMHPVLRVSHCKKCHTFYNSGEFSKGEDGSELYCRWCGQGGEVYCCSQCPYVFCRKCITLNLSKPVVNEIMNNDNWHCFGCSPKALWPLRAQHWAHVNMIEKLKRKILSENTDDDVIYKLMNKDLSTCCKDKKVKTKEKRKRKRRNSSSSSSCRSTPEPKRVASDGSAKLPNLLTYSQRKTETKQKSANNEDDAGIVCTPDILSFLNEQTDERAAASKTSKPSKPSKPSTASTPSNASAAVTSAAPVPSKKSTKTTLAPAPPTTVSVAVTTASSRTISTQPPPLVIRQYTPPTVLTTASQPAVTNGRRMTTQVRPATSGGNTPVYHTINGFRIDLNTASQQETYRLPNGKLIQVKKQPTTYTQPLGQGNQPRNIAPSNIAPRPQTFTTIRYNVQPVPQNNHTQLQLQHLQQQQQLLNGLTPTPTAVAVPQPTPNQTIIRQATPQPVRLPMTTYPNTPLGHARTRLEAQLHGSQEVCQHIIGKMNTLMVSNAYKSAHSYNDVKELQIHLSYLLTYAIGRFKGLQDKCVEEMKKLGFAAEAANLQEDKIRNYKEADDDLEIVEPEQALIEIDSDDDNDVSLTEPILNRINTSAEPQEMSPVALVETIMDMTEDSGDELEIPMPPQLDPLPDIDINVDPKLNTPALVRIPKIDDILPELKDKIEEFLKNEEAEALLLLNPTEDESENNGSLTDTGTDNEKSLENGVEINQGANDDNNSSKTNSLADDSAVDKMVGKDSDNDESNENGKNSEVAKSIVNNLTLPNEDLMSKDPLEIDESEKQSDHILDAIKPIEDPIQSNEGPLESNEDYIKSNENTAQLKEKTNKPNENGLDNSIELSNKGENELKRNHDLLKEIEGEIDAVPSVSNNQNADDAIDNDTERQLLEEPIESNDADDISNSEFENISSPDNFEDLSKNGLDDPNAAQEALNDLLSTI